MAALGSLWGRSWAALGALLAALGPLLGTVGPLLAPLGPLRLKFFQKELILAFEANSALSRENETKIVKITHSALSQKKTDIKYDLTFLSKKQNPPASLMDP